MSLNLRPRVKHSDLFQELQPLDHHHPDPDQAGRGHSGGPLQPDGEAGSDEYRHLGGQTLERGGDQHHPHPQDQHAGRKHCDQSYDIFNSYLDYQDFSLDMTGLDRWLTLISLSLLTPHFSAYNAILEKIFRLFVSTANLSLERIVRAWVTGILENILC